jgi:hypothetical protein
MDALEQIKKLKEEILATVRESEKLNAFSVQINRLVSHMESERRVSNEHGHKINQLMNATFGNQDDGEIGDHHRVSVIWRIHVWLLCTLSAAAGSIVTLIITNAFSKP